MSETRDDRAGRLLALGLQLAARLREEDPADVRRTVDAMPADEVRDLALLIAACVPVDVSPSVLLGWWQHPRSEPYARAPCGTPSAAKRHRERGEPVDPLCGWAIREYDRVRKRVK